MYMVTRTSRTTRQTRRMASMSSAVYQHIELQLQNAAAIVADVTSAVDNVVAAQRVLGDSQRYDALLGSCSDAAVAGPKSPGSEGSGSAAGQLSDILTKTTSSDSEESTARRCAKRSYGRPADREPRTALSRLRWNDETCASANAAAAFAPLRAALAARPAQAALELIAQRRCEESDAEAQAPGAPPEMLLLLDWYAVYETCLAEESVARGKLQGEANVSAALIKQRAVRLQPPAAPPLAAAVPSAAQTASTASAHHKLARMGEDEADERLRIEVEAQTAMLECYRNKVKYLDDVHLQELLTRPIFAFKTPSVTSTLRPRPLPPPPDAEPGTQAQHSQRQGDGPEQEKAKTPQGHKRSSLLPSITVFRYHPSRKERLAARPPIAPMSSAQAPRHLGVTPQDELANAMKRQHVRDGAHSSRAAASAGLTSERASQRPMSSCTLRSMATQSTVTLPRQGLLPLFTVEDVPRRKRR